MPEDDFLEALEAYENPSPDETVLSEEVKNCWSAIKAAAEAIGDYCGGVGMGVPIETEGVSVSAPPEIIEIARSNPELTREDRITAIIESDWGRNTSAGMCEKLFGAEPGTPEYERCVESTARRLAVGMID
ncbi:MAG: hypothetical protein U9R15_04470 [Chloroflexota bacterium]|nr:hypothetical protein [Chloroflexota bacterium]